MATMAKFPPVPAELAALVDPNLFGAACAGHAPLFDPRQRGESPARATRRHNVARRICQTCPVKRQCADALVDLPLKQRAGIWAGVDASQITTTSRKDYAA